MPLGATHWNVQSPVRDQAVDVVRRFGGTWNTYLDHPDGYALDDVSVDFWGPGGRGSPVGEARGTDISAWILGQNEIFPVAWLIWWGWWWRPDIGWKPYGNWMGGHFDHVHVTYLRHSNTARKLPVP